jgi:hypothetical protein
LHGPVYVLAKISIRCREKRIDFVRRAMSRLLVEFAVRQRSEDAQFAIVILAVKQ